MAVAVGTGVAVGGRMATSAVGSVVGVAALLARPDWRPRVQAR